MPTYDNKCRKCGFEFETFQSITEKPVELCPKCGGRVERLIRGGSGLLFKGNGFYITDYRSESYKKAAQAEKSEHKTSDSSSKITSVK
jgi:putative FmdB family regulatory protein